MVGIPIDLVYHLMAHLEQSSKYAFCLVDRRMSQFIKPSLYKDPRLNTSLSCIKFVRTMISRPEYARYVEAIDLGSLW